jgi:hypothetical protein
MSRIRTALVAVPLAAVSAAAALMLGAGSAAADNGAFAGGNSSSTTVSDTGSGNLSGWVDGNANWAQQTATGAGASNQNNTLGVKGNTGTLYSSQSNVRIVFG